MMGVDPMRIKQVLISAVLTVALVAAVSGGFGLAQEAGLKIVRDVLASAVENREPVEATAPIQATVGQLFYFTEIEGGPGTIEHVWTWEGRTMATVTLDVRTPRFRTWSSKRLQPEWTGQWRVEARTSDGNVLSFKEFVVE